MLCNKGFENNRVNQRKQVCVTLCVPLQQRSGICQTQKEKEKPLMVLCLHLNSESLLTYVTYRRTCYSPTLVFYDSLKQNPNIFECVCIDQNDILQ
jgi:hypothetical protein